MYGLVKNKKSLNEVTPFHLDLFTEFQRYLHIIQLCIIEKPTEFFASNGIFLTMNRLEEVQHLLQKNCSRFS